jgi:succinate-semialdehyde dehydrogenase/glutarate-semialdehyde dehydrogenase
MQNLNDKELFRQQGLIGGQWLGALSGATIDVIDPATQTILGTVPNMGRDDSAPLLPLPPRLTPPGVQRPMPSAPHFWKLGMGS